MIKLKSLRLQNFNSYLDSTVHFSESGMVLVKGTDVSTGESSGTGKSSLFLGVAYALDILPSDFSAKGFQNWETSSAMQVELVIEVNGVDISLKRGKVTSISGGGNNVTGANAYKNELSKILGVSKEILRALTYRHQGEGGFLVSLDPSESMSFFSEVLGLRAVEEEVEKAKGAVKYLSEKVRSDESSIVSLERVLSSYGTEALPEIDMEGISTAKDAVLELEQKLEARKKEASEKVKASTLKIESDLDRSVSFEKELREAFNKKHSEWKLSVSPAIAEKTIAKNKMVQTLNAQLSQIKQLEKLIAKPTGVCAECNRPWEEAEKVRAQRIADKKYLEDSCRALAVDLDALLKEISNLESHGSPELDPRIDQLAKLAESLRRKMTETRYVTSTHEGLRVSEVLAELESAKRKLNGLQDQLREYEYRKREIASHEEMKNNVGKEIADIKEKIKLNSTQLALEQDIVTVLGKEGFLGTIFDDILREIATEANRALSRVTNVKDVTVDFSTENEAGKKKIELIVNVRGNRTSFRQGLSGGMGHAVAQVLDLALVKVLCARTGTQMPGWLLLDEVTDGLGNVSKEAAYEIFKEYANDRLILVIDHGTEVKESFSEVINVSFKNGVSSVKA